MPRPDEGVIHAWLDGELDAGEMSRVAKLVAEDAEWGAAAAEARGLVAASSRILDALDLVAGDVIPSGSRAAPAVSGISPRAAAPVTTRRFMVRPWMRIAAGMVLVVGTAYVARERARPSPSESEKVERSAPTKEASARRTPADAVTAAAATAVDAPATAPALTESVAPSVAPSAAPSAALPLKAPVVSARTMQGARRARSDEVDAANAAPGASAPPALAAKSAVAAPSPVGAVANEPTAAVASPPSMARGVAGGVASGRVADPSSVDAREERARSTAQGFADARRVSIEGCWRSETTALADTVLVDPRVARQRGDTLWIVIARSGALASVVRSGLAALQGSALDATGVVVPFRATRTACAGR